MGSYDRDCMWTVFVYGGKMDSRNKEVEPYTQTDKEQCRWLRVKAADVWVVIFP